MFATDSPERAAAYRAGGLTLFLAAGVILAALAFEYLGGYAPCPLCLVQRYAYYAAIPLLLIGMALTGEMPRLAAAIYAVVAIAFLVNAGLGVYHSGVEWKFWPGPDTCATVQRLPTTAADLLKELPQTLVVRCDDAPWRFLGLSFAGWNAVFSLIAFAGALRAAVLAGSARTEAPFKS